MTRKLVSMLTTGRTWDENQTFLRTKRTFAQTGRSTTSSAHTAMDAKMNTGAPTATVGRSNSSTLATIRPAPASWWTAAARVTVPTFIQSKTNASCSTPTSSCCQKTEEVHFLKLILTSTCTKSFSSESCSTRSTGPAKSDIAHILNSSLFRLKSRLCMAAAPKACQSLTLWLFRLSNRSVSSMRRKKKHKPASNNTSNLQHFILSQDLRTLITCCSTSSNSNSCNSKSCTRLSCNNNQTFLLSLLQLRLLCLCSRAQAQKRNYQKAKMQNETFAARTILWVEGCHFIVLHQLNTSQSTIQSFNLPKKFPRSSPTLHLPSRTTSATTKHLGRRVSQTLAK